VAEDPAVGAHSRSGAAGPTLSSQCRQLSGLSRISRQNELGRRRQTEVSPESEQTEIGGEVLRLTSVCEEILQTACETWVRETAAVPRWRGVLANPKFDGEGELSAARPALQIAQAGSIDSARGLGGRRRKVSRRQRAEYAALHSGGRLDRPQARSALAERRLSENLTGEQEFKTSLSRDLIGSLQHERPAPAATLVVENGSCTTLDYLFHVVRRHIDDRERAALTSGGPCDMLCNDPFPVVIDEAGIEMDAFNVDTLPLEQSDGQEAVQAACEQSQYFHVSCGSLGGFAAPVMSRTCLPQIDPRNVEHYPPSGDTFELRFHGLISLILALACGACPAAFAAAPEEEAAAAAERFSQAMVAGDPSLLRPILPRSGKVQLRLELLGPERGYFSAPQVVAVLADFLAHGKISSVEILRVEQSREGFAVVHGQAALTDRQGRPFRVDIHLGLQPESDRWVLREIRETPQ
jgi:hypothetical protein